MAREHKTIQSYSQATVGSRERAGKQLLQCVLMAGKHEETHLHCIGDGAPWIAEQVEQQFGSNASFLIDFYHLAQYLAEAAQCCQQNDSSTWLARQKKLILENQTEDVFLNLQKHIDLKSCRHEKCPAEKCFNYMNKRRKYLDYKGASDKGLPVGSGEIESGIRSIIQSRLKLPGAWWLEKNADVMLSLKTVRANGLWKQYWHKQQDFSSKSLVQS